MTLTDADLARLEALDKAATAGPWVTTSLAGLVATPHAIGLRGVAGPLVDRNRTNDPDAALIAEFRNRTPDLVAELRESRAALARVKALCDEAENYPRRGRLHGGALMPARVDTRAILAAIEGASGE